MTTFPTEKAKKIRLFILDVDGVLTSGRVYYGPNQLRLLDFHVHDGLGMKLLQRSGVELAIITARSSDALTERMQELGVTHVFQNQHNKLTAYESLKEKLSLTDAEIAYVGDDLTDLALLKRVGFSATVANAPKILQEHVDWITSCAGGSGAVRELCEAIMHAQNTLTPLLHSFL
ncbi:MAG: HAD-IIIA family hydrolase [Gammaproteobacteria bacterium]|nr:HAD-IIIA family hydrolase [Gammaproteobacteria bacterium]